MKITQSFPLKWNLKTTFELTETKLIQKWTSFTHSGSSEYLLNTISPASVRVKNSDSTFESYAWFFAATTGVISFLDNHFPIPLYVFFISLGITLFFILFYFFKKSEYEIFVNKTDQGLFSIRYTREGKEKAFIEELKLKTSK